jgi:hypothetical protein
MININELRTGNLIRFERFKDKFEYCRINNAIQLADIENSQEHYNRFYSYVPLTPEILEKCGFENNEIFKETITIVVDLDYPTEFGYAVDGCGVTAKIIIPRWIKYLHQLQNLYFDLTGEELTISVVTHFEI